MLNHFGNHMWGALAGGLCSAFYSAHRVACALMYEAGQLSCRLLAAMNHSTWTATV